MFIPVTFSAPGPHPLWDRGGFLSSSLEWPLPLFQGAGGRQFLREAETGNLVYCLRQEVQTSLCFEVLNNKFHREWKGEKLQDSWAGVKCAGGGQEGKKGPRETGTGFVWRERVLNRSGYRGQEEGQGVTSFCFLREPVLTENTASKGGGGSNWLNSQTQSSSKRKQNQTPPPGPTWLVIKCYQRSLCKRIPPPTHKSVLHLGMREDKILNWERFAIALLNCTP